MNASDSKAIMMAKIEAGAPHTLDELYERASTPGGMSTADLLKFVEYQSKVLGILQPDKQSNFVPVTITFVNGGEMQIGAPAEEPQMLTEVRHDEPLEVQTREVPEPTKPQAEAPIDWLSVLEADLGR